MLDPESSSSISEELKKILTARNLFIFVEKVNKFGIYLKENFICFLAYLLLFSLLCELVSPTLLSASVVTDLLVLPFVVVKIMQSPGLQIMLSANAVLRGSCEMPSKPLVSVAVLDFLSFKIGSHRLD